MLQTTLSPDVLIQTPVGEFRGQEGLDLYLEAEAEAFPHAVHELLDLTTDGDVTTVCWRMTYQDTMTFFGRATLTAENGTVVAINVLGPGHALGNQSGGETALNPCTPNRCP